LIVRFDICPEAVNVRTVKLGRHDLVVRAAVMASGIHFCCLLFKTRCAGSWFLASNIRAVFEQLFMVWLH